MSEPNPQKHTSKMTSLTDKQGPASATSTTHRINCLQAANPGAAHAQWFSTKSEMVRRTLAAGGSSRRFEPTPPLCRRRKPKPGADQRYSEIRTLSLATTPVRARQTSGQETTNSKLTSPCWLRFRIDRGLWLRPWPRALCTGIHAAPCQR